MAKYQSAYANRETIMPFALHAFSVARPYAYHLTSRNNLRLICDAGCLESAAELIVSAARLELLRQRRTDPTLIQVRGAAVQLRDQAPLHAANIAFEDGWQLGDLVEQLNSLVFFWPGTARGPNASGRRHFARYRDENPVLLRVGTTRLITQNPGITPLFCRFNSGSPRYSGGRASPRGRDTFASSDHFLGGLSEVVEFTFPTRVLLGSSTEFSYTPDGPWHKLGNGSCEIGFISDVE